MDFDPNIYETGMVTRARLASSGRISRTAGGGQRAYLFRPTTRCMNVLARNSQNRVVRLTACLIFYQFQLKLLEMSKEQKSMCLLGKLHVLSNMGEQTTCSSEGFKA